MDSSSIKVSNLTKQFSFPIKDSRKHWVSNLFAPQKKEITAVNDISFSVNYGERIAFIGPNGAGKSTVIKMLTGILFPTDGRIQVLGLNPMTERKKLAYQIGTVFGQRSQLLPNLPLTDSFEFFGVMYDMADVEIIRRTKELVELFDLHSFLDQPVRKLSLGQRMRAEIAASLIHNPKIVLLDEPTIGLDVVAKKSLRDLLVKINHEKKTTIFLTSHDVGDIESLCERAIIINHGVIVKDLPTKELSRTFLNEKYIDLIPKDRFMHFPVLPKGIHYRVKENNKLTLLVKLEEITVQNALKKLLDLFDVEDLNVFNSDLETVIRHIYERNTPRA